MVSRSADEWQSKRVWKWIRNLTSLGKIYIEVDTCCESAIKKNYNHLAIYPKQNKWNLDEEYINRNTLYYYIIIVISMIMMKE